MFGSIGTLDGDLSFIYQFIDILERLFEMIANFFTGITGGSKESDDAADDVVTE